MMAIGDKAVKELQARNSKDDIFDKDLKWIKEKWEEAWKASNFISQSFVKTMQATREKSETMHQFWTRIAGLVAKIKIDSMTTTEMENALQVATFTVGVNDDEMVKMIWEKKLSFTELDKAIKDSNEARQILQQNQKVTVKQEPIGRIKREKKTEKKERKKLCIRCGETYSPEHSEIHPVKSKKCNYCKKTGHLQSVCQKKLRDESKKDKKSSKIAVVEEGESEASEENDQVSTSEPTTRTSSSDLNSDESPRAEKCRRIREVSKVPFRKNREGDLIAKVNAIKPKHGKVIELAVQKRERFHSNIGHRKSNNNHAEEVSKMGEAEYTEFATS